MFDLIAKHIEVIETLVAGAFAALFAVAGWSYGRRKLTQQTARDYKEAYDAKITECQQCQASWHKKLEVLTERVDTLDEMYKQKLELNKFLIAEREGLLRRISELEVKMAYLERELQASK